MSAATQALESIRALVNIHTTVDDPVGYFLLAVRVHHSAYDVRFLALAQRLGVPLVTADEVFAAKIRRERVPVEVQTLSA